MTLAACSPTGQSKNIASRKIDSPPLRGRVVDQANLLAPADEAMIANRLETLERTTGHQAVVVTVKSLGNSRIEDYARDLGNRWRIGRRGFNDGVLLVVAPNERKIRIATGKGLTTMLTNADAQSIIDHAIIPRFRTGDMRGGIIGGAKGIVDELAKPTDATR